MIFFKLKINALTFTICYTKFMKREQQVEHRFLCCLSYVKMAGKMSLTVNGLTI